MSKTINLMALAATVLLLLILQSTVNAATGDRQSLAQDSSVVALFSIDERHTFVQAGGPGVVEGYTVINDYGDGSYIVRHDTDQPLLSKGVSGERIKRGEPRSNGDFELLATELDGRTGSELFASVSGLCAESGGRPTFVATITSGRFKRLAEVSPLEAFDYIRRTAVEDGAWYMACKGDERRFLVEKAHRIFTNGAETAAVKYGVGLEGVNYVAAGEDPAPPPVLAIGGESPQASLEMTFR